jgi:spore protease
MNAFRRTDLASELDFADRSGISERRETVGSFTVHTVEIITEAAAARLGKPCGKYITLELGRIWLADDADFRCAAGLLADKLAMLASEMAGSPPERILIAGLGNRHITADALGDQAAGLITVTRHIRSRSSSLFRMLGGREISAVTPGVLGQTGIETAELVRGAAVEVKPELIIAIDALCARSASRLATNIQLGTSGISPGSGIGNHRRAINAETLGVPVIALGVPTVVDAAALILEAIEEAGIDAGDERLAEVLKKRRGYFVTPKETDTIVRELARLIADGISQAFDLPHGFGAY